MNNARHTVSNRYTVLVLSSITVEGMPRPTSGLLDYNTFAKTQALQAQVKCCRSQVEDWFPVPPSKDCGARSLAETQDEKAEEADNQHSLSHKLLACDGASTLHRVSGKTRRVYTQLDKGPETPRTT